MNGHSIDRNVEIGEGVMIITPMAASLVYFYAIKDELLELNHGSSFT